MSLKLEEWPAEAIPYMAARIIDIAIDHRKRSGLIMIPSPLPAAHYRARNGGSLHNIGEDKSGFSYATDFYGANSQAESMWLSLTANEAIGGIGIYFDVKLGGKKRVLYHIDDMIKRSSRMMWICPDQEQREYIYYHKEPVRFLRTLANELELLNEHI
jgi:hypothetical protein